MKTVILLFLILFLAPFLNVTQLSEGLYQNSESIVIHEDGSVTPLSAPVNRSGDVYTLKDDIYIPTSTNEGVIIEKDGITLDGAGHKIRGNGQSSAIYMENIKRITIKNVMLEGFYWGLEMWRCTECTINDCNLTAGVYPLYLKYSSYNLFYHNNIYGGLYYEDSDNTWDNGYPSGGNYWRGYPYPDTKSGSNQNLPGSDGIGDVKVGEEIFSQGGKNVDNYPLFSARVWKEINPSPSPTLTPTPTPTQTPKPTPTPTSTPTPTQTPKPTPTLTPTPSTSPAPPSGIPGFPAESILIGLIVATAISIIIKIKK